MLFEIRRVCLYKLCPKCGGKLFRYLRKGTYESEEYGVTHGLQVWDRCEECREVFGSTDIALHTASLEEGIVSIFTGWEQQGFTDKDFVEMIRCSFRAVGGWIISPEQRTG